MIIHNPILTGSFTVNGTDVASITSSAASITAINSYTASQNILNGTYTLTSSFAAQTASFTAFTSSVNSFTASQLVLNGTYATTGSNTFAGIQTVNSNLIVTGSITAATLVVQTITSSVDFVTGSTRFGSSLSTSTHQFTGSVNITGSVAIASAAAYALDVTGTGRFTGALSGTSATFSSSVTIAGTNDGYGTLYVSALASTNAARLRNDNASFATLDINNANASGTGVYSVASKNYFSGNVGIGTSSPASLLSIQRGASGDNMEIIGSGASGYSDILFYNTNKVTRLGYIDWSDTQARWNVEANIPLILYTSGSERMRITSGGKVTIPSGAYGTSYYTMNYTSANAGSREWAIGSDTSGWGSFSIGQATTQGGSTFSDKIVIKDGGNVLIGSTSDQGSWKAQVTGNLFVRGSTSNDTATGIYLDNSTGNVLFYVRNDGLIITGAAANSPTNLTNAAAANVFVGTSGILYKSTASSIRFKENINNWDGNGLNTILALKPKTFTYKESYYKHPEVEMLGLIAEEVAEVCPYLAEYENEDRTGQVENVRYATIVVPLIKAVQEQQAQIEELKKQIKK